MMLITKTAKVKFKGKKYEVSILCDSKITKLELEKQAYELLTQYYEGYVAAGEFIKEV